MATIVPFQPSQLQAFQFQATLTDLTGTTSAYNVIVTWLYAGGKRNGVNWYVNLFDQNGIWVFTLPLIGSPPDYDISLTAGYFSTKLVYRVGIQSFEVG